MARSFGNGHGVRYKLRLTLAEGCHGVQKPLSAARWNQFTDRKELGHLHSRVSRLETTSSRVVIMRSSQVHRRAVGSLRYWVTDSAELADLECVKKYCAVSQVSRIGDNQPLWAANLSKTSLIDSSTRQLELKRAGSAASGDGETTGGLPSSCQSQQRFVSLQQC